MNSELRVAGFAPRQLNRWVLRGKIGRVLNSIGYFLLLVIQSV